MLHSKRTASFGHISISFIVYKLPAAKETSHFGPSGPLGPCGPIGPVGPISPCAPLGPVIP
ncbi:hypothetical protein DW220_08765 [Eubacterium sp. AM18-26]|nr:hypothetical protein DW220_08765 [Eubacterium sp. AM18-26]RHO24790.1 hypothetical protein DW212_08880 [Eubacterium sp. AM18-10LB-B]RHO29710.1 hypothetical protein DW208_06815 [Erysipelotrichaceae bacterium AM17-60]